MPRNSPSDLLRTLVGSRRSARSLVGLVAIGAPAALGLAACSSTTSSAATTSSSPATTKAPATSNTTGLGGSANRLCSEVSTAVRDFHHVDLSSPSSLSTASTTINRDLQRLQATLHSISAAGQKTSGPLGNMISEAHAAVNEAHLAAAQLAKGNLGSAHSDFNIIVTDVRTARADGARANIRTCI